MSCHQSFMLPQASIFPPSQSPDQDPLQAFRKSREPLEPQEMFAETPALLRSIPHHRHRTSYALSCPHLLSNSSVDCGLLVRQVHLPEDCVEFPVGFCRSIMLRFPCPIPLSCAPAILLLRLRHVTDRKIFYLLSLIRTHYLHII
jgi:hypothetical protein